MKVLVSCKTTNLNVYGESIRKKIAAGLLSPDHLERLQEDHDYHHRTRDVLLSSLEKYKIEVVEVRRGLFWPDLHDVDAIVTVGGDGTVLEASQHIHEEEVPVLGLRSSPMSVGYLCPFTENEILEMVKAFAKGKLRLITVNRLEGLVNFTATGGSITTDPVLNDFLFVNANPAATTRYRMVVGEQTTIQKSSGVWLSTAAGSTAAIAAAGGRSLPLDSGLSQYWVRELYQPPYEKKDPLQNGMLDLNKTSLLIENLNDHAVLALDGRRGTVTLSFGDQIRFSNSHPLKLYQKAL